MSWSPNAAAQAYSRVSVRVDRYWFDPCSSFPVGAAPPGKTYLMVDIAARNEPDASDRGPYGSFEWFLRFDGGHADPEFEPCDFGKIPRPAGVAPLPTACHTGAVLDPGVEVCTTFAFAVAPNARNFVVVYTGGQRNVEVRLPE